MYRDAIKVTQSIYRLSCELPMVGTIYHFGLGNAKRLGMGLSLMGMPSDHFKKMTIYENFSLGLTMVCLGQITYQRFRDAGLEIAGVRFEDLIKDPTESMRTILRYCTFPEDNVGKCQKAMEFDSQAGSPLSTKVLNKHPTVEYVGAAKEESDRLCDLFNVPHVDQEYIAPGTITYKEKAKGTTS